MTRGGTPAANIGFSEREALIVRLAASGMIDRDICNALQIAPGTLSTYWSRIRHKSGHAPRPAITSRLVRLEAQQETESVLAHIAETSQRRHQAEPSTHGLWEALKESFAGLPVLAFTSRADGTLVDVTHRLRDEWGPAWAPGSRLSGLLKFDEHAAVLKVLGRPERAPVTVRLTNAGEMYDASWRPLSARNLWLAVARKDPDCGGGAVNPVEPG